MFSETLGMTENFERFRIKTGQPYRYFTTGFPNWLYTIKNQHVKETKYITMIEPYYERGFK